MGDKKTKKDEGETAKKDDKGKEQSSDKKQAGNKKPAAEKKQGITGVIGDTGIYKGSIYSHKQSKQMEKAIKEYKKKFPGSVKDFYVTPSKKDPNKIYPIPLKCGGKATHGYGKAYLKGGKVK